MWRTDKKKGGRERRKEKGKSLLKTTIRTFFPKIFLQNKNFKGSYLSLIKKTPLRYLSFDLETII